MAIEVRIPTILRTYTGGERVVPGSGSTVTELIDQLEADHTGIKERLIENGEARRFVNIYVSDGDTVVILPAVAGGAR
jgi:molybdopterin synthase sulfur carrier subunit